ncbi:hypothetical protein ACHAWF_001108, partial [Thalassiosira exigua]
MNLRLAVLILAGGLASAKDQNKGNSNGPDPGIFEMADGGAKDSAGAEDIDVVPSAAKEASKTLTIPALLGPRDMNHILPHRYPFLMVDKVVQYEQGKRAVGVISVPYNSPHVIRHDTEPRMFGHAMLEAAVQVASIVSHQMDGAEPGAVFFFAGVDEVKWKKPVVPGAVLVMEVNLTDGQNYSFDAMGYADGEVAIELKNIMLKCDSGPFPDSSSEEVYAGNEARSAKDISASLAVSKNTYNLTFRWLAEGHQHVMVDKVIEYEQAKRLVGMKVVHGNEPFFH